MHKVIEQFVDSLRDPVNVEKERFYYKQRHALRNEFGHCAGGVLCDLMSKEYPDKYSWSVTGSDEGFSFKVKHGFDSNATVPEDVNKDCGIPRIFIVDKEIKKMLEAADFPPGYYDHILSDNGIDFRYEGRVDLETMNDLGLDWSVIADIVEHVARKFGVGN